jgi:Zn-dependent membrane protease YugP
VTFADWARYFLLTCSVWILRRAVATLYLTVKRRVDRMLPDNLDVGAGPWLRSLIDARKMDVKVLVELSKDEDVDAFYPSARAVRLSQEVYFKRDPSYWAVAAHELGHAIVWGKSKLIGIPLAAARFGNETLVAMGGALILVNVLYGIPEVSTFGVRAYELGTALYVFTLIDEASASTIGMRLLRADGRIDARGMWGARLRLIAAFLTYVAAFGGLLIFVSQERWITTMIALHRHFVPGARTSHAVLIVLASLVLGVANLTHVVRIVRRPNLTSIDAIKKQKTRDFIHWFATDAIAIGVVWLVWDQPFGKGFAIACILGLFGSRMGLVLLLLPATVLVFGVAYLVVMGVIVATSRFWLHKWKPKDDASPPDPSEEELAETRKAAEQMYVDAYNHPGWHQTTVKLGNALCQLYFLVMLWLALSRS